MNELFNGVIPDVVKERATEAIKHMTEEEIAWTSYITDGILGFSERSIRWFVEAQANSVCKNLKLPLIYEEIPDRDNPLRMMLLDRISTASRGTLFDTPGTEYTRNFKNNLPF